MRPDHVIISDIGHIIEISPNAIRENGTVTAGRILVDGYGVGDVGSVVLRDRKRLAEDGMIVVVVTMSCIDHTVLSGPEIITRGFVYVKESEKLMDEVRQLAANVLAEVRPGDDWAAIKGEIKRELSGFLFRKAKRSPMILPVIMEV